MTYYKIIERDKARQEHLREMEKITTSMCDTTNKEDYLFLFHKLELYKTQLELYDKIMGYSKCLTI